MTAFQKPLIWSSARQKSIAAADLLTNIIGSSTFASLPAASSVPAFIQPFYVSDVGINGSYWVSNGTNWRLMTSPQMVKGLSTPIADNGGTGIAIQSQILFPPGSLQVGSRLRVELATYKAGTAQTHTWVIKMGSAGTTSDTSLMTYQLSASNIQLATLLDFMIDSNTTIHEQLQNVFTTPFGTSTGAESSDVTIPNITSNALYLSIASYSGGATEVGTIKMFNVLLFMP